MQFEECLQHADFILAEGSVYERLRRHDSITYDPHLAHATLIYDRDASNIFARVHHEYLDIGQKHGLAMVTSTATWRANCERVGQSAFRDHSINQDNARFLCAIRDSYRPNGSPIFVAGLTGPKGDAYKPEEAPGCDEARSFHAYQVEALADTDVDYLLAATLPALSEAQGIAAAMAATDLPYIISFVIRRNGALLDGTPLRQAIKEIDAASHRSPTGYAVNCVHPSVFLEGMAQGDDSAWRDRIVSFNANTSAKTPEELDGLAELDSEEPDHFAASMATVYERLNTPILGGCCGTGTEHIACLAGQINTTEARSHRKAMAG